MVLLDLLVAGGVLVIRHRDRATPVAVGTALERFRSGLDPAVTTTVPSAPTKATLQTTAGEASTPASAPSSRDALPTAAPPHAAQRQQPAAGVYVYDTSGWEETDALGGGRHDYPAQTTITVRPEGCGVVTRWDVFEDRSETIERCPSADGGETIAGFVSRHGFFGQRDERTFRCESDSILLPPSSAPVGATGTYRCDSSTTTNTTTWSIVGYERIAVGANVVDAVHVRAQSTPSGDTSGSMRCDRWWTVSNGLLVRERAEVTSSTEAGAITADYREQYELRLQRLEPLR